MQQALGARVQRREIGIAHLARERDPVRGRVPAPERVVKERRELAEIAGDDEAEIAVTLGRARERGHEAVHVLARIELTDVQHERPIESEHAIGLRAAHVGVGRVERGVDGLGDHGHARLGHPETLDDVALGRLGHGDDRVSALRQRVLRLVPDP